MKVKLRTIGANQNEVNIGDVSLFFSYQTLVGVFITGRGYFRTSTKYSKTTSGHINKWLDGIHATEVSQEALEALAQAVTP